MSVNRAVAKKPSGVRRERGPAWHRKSTRTAILEAARALAMRDGIEKLTLNRVAQEAGFAPATVYAYFVRTADVFAAIVAEDIATFARIIKDEFIPSAVADAPEAHSQGEQRSSSSEESADGTADSTIAKREDEAVQTSETSFTPASLAAEADEATFETPENSQSQDAAEPVSEAAPVMEKQDAPAVPAGVADVRPVEILTGTKAAVIGPEEVNETAESATVEPPPELLPAESSTVSDEAQCGTPLEETTTAVAPECGVASVEAQKLMDGSHGSSATPAVAEPTSSGSALSALEARVAQLEARRADPWLERRLREFERMLAAVEERVAANERGSATAVAPIDNGLQELRQRMEAWETQRSEAQTEQTKSFGDTLEATESRLKQAVSDLRARLLDLCGRLEIVERDKEARALAEEMPATVPVAAEPHGDFAPSHASDAPATEDVKPDASEDGDASYLVAARRAALAAQSLAHGDTKDFGSAGLNRRQTRLLVGLCVGLGVLLASFGLVLKHNLAPPQSSASMHSSAARRDSLLAPVALTLPTPAPRGEDAKAILGTGLGYFNGERGTPDDARAADWISKAAMRGEPVAEYWLGTLFEHGRGEPVDPAEAIRWYEASALQGNLKAMYKLAVSYAEGWGTQKNYGEAARWFSRAGEMGFVNAQYNLGVLYERGLGVPQSLLDAYKWYALAAAQGDKDSASRVDALSSQMSAEDLATARQAVTAFKPEVRDAYANAIPPRASNGSAAVPASTRHAKKS